MAETIFRTVLRVFLKTLAFFVGIWLGLALLTSWMGALGDKTSTITMTTDYTPEILPNAEGIRKELSATTPVILQLNIVGVIGSDSLNADTFNQQLTESREGQLKDERVKALFLYINSPGGTVVDSDAIYRAILDYKHRYQVPVYAFIDGYCASGGFYIACAADKIYSTDSSLVGSIGVLTPPLFNFYKLIDKVGVSALTLSAGKDKDLFDPWRPWRPGEQDQLQGIIDSYYRHFVAIVTKHRPRIDKEKLISDYGAGLFIASEGQTLGFVDDANSSRPAVLKALLSAADLEGQEYQVLQLHSKNWLKELWNARSSLTTGTIVHQFDLGDGLPSKLRGQFLYFHHFDR